MTCKSCAERRRKLAELKAAKKAKRQFIQAGAIGAVLKVSDLVNGEVKEDEWLRGLEPGSIGGTNPEDERGSQGPEQDR